MVFASKILNWMLDCCGHWQEAVSSHSLDQVDRVILSVTGGLTMVIMGGD